MRSSKVKIVAVLTSMVFGLFLGISTAEVAYSDKTVLEWYYCFTGGVTKNEIMSLFVKINPGDRVEFVVQLINREKGQLLTLSDRINDTGYLVVESPMQWNAKNAFIYIEIDSGKVKSSRLRTQDSFAERFSSWPPDKGDLE